MRKTAIFSALLSVGVLAMSGFGQINLSYLNSQSVRTWAWTGTRMDSVTIETTVGNGLATTMVTFSVEPQGYYNCRSVYLSTPDTVWYLNYQYNSAKGTYDTLGRTYYLSWYRTVCDSNPTSLDSLEISTWFNLPTDFVAKNMWLWIDGKPVVAYIQDKMLAETQYTQIVGRRKDPALLTYSGNGSYGFRMFPLSSYQARKVAIEFEHTFSDDTLNLISACVPVTFDTANTYWYWWGGIGQQKHGIGNVKVTLSATDNKKYSFFMPGVGGGTFTKNKSLTVGADNVVKLGVGDITASDPSGSDAYAWSGYDAKTAAPEMGFSTMLAESTVVLEPEPNTRIIVLDIHQKMWDWKAYYKAEYQAQGYTWDETYFTGDYYAPFDMWKRAQKFAVVSLKNYVDSGRKFNLIINGKPVFAGPVAGTSENLLAAYSAIVAASPDPAASTVDGLKKAVDQTGKDMIVFISDFMSPPDGFGPYQYNSTTGYGMQDTNPSGKAYCATADSLTAVMKSFTGNLFTICDDYSLSTLSYQSGGFQLASLRNRYYYYYPLYYSNSGGLDTLANKMPALPRLYLDRGGITDVKVTFADGTSDGLKYTLDGYGYWWWGWRVGSVMVDKAVLAKKTKVATMALPYYYAANSQLLRAAFPAPQSQPAAQLVITGKMGGLSFTKRITAVRDALADSPRSAQWAFRASEYLAHTPWNSQWQWSNWAALQDSIKAIGYAYHIITTNTAFLALEPGMSLTVDTSMAAAQAASNSKGGETMDAAIAAPTTTAQGTGTSLDDIPLEDLIAGKMPVKHETSVAKVVGEFSISVARSRIAVTVPTTALGRDITLTMYDMKGRTVMSRNVSSQESRGGSFTWNLASTGARMSNGLYLLRISAGSMGKVFRLPALR
jgi:hypothetical protein